MPDVGVSGIRHGRRADAREPSRAVRRRWDPRRTAADAGHSTGALGGTLALVTLRHPLRRLAARPRGKGRASRRTSEWMATARMGRCRVDRRAGQSGWTSARAAGAAGGASSSTVRIEPWMPGEGMPESARCPMRAGAPLPLDDVELDGLAPAVRAEASAGSAAELGASAVVADATSVRGAAAVCAAYAA